MRNVLIAAVISAVVTGGVYLATRPEGAARSRSASPTDRAPVDPAPVVPRDEGPGQVPVPQQGTAFLRDVVRQLRQHLAELRDQLRSEEDPAAREMLRAQMRALREGIEQVEQRIAER